MEKTLIYVADPMCSWCWGFSPVMAQLVERYQPHATIRLLLGGLRPGNTERFDEQKRAYILSHWHAVHARTGQPFNFAFQMGPAFTYDTEPSSRAIVAIRKLAPGKVWSFLQNVQEAFYVRNMDVTREETLADLAGIQAIERDEFLNTFHDPVLNQEVWEEFDQARQWGVSGFPTLLGQSGQEHITITHGYQPVENVIPRIDQWLHFSPPDFSSSPA